MHSFLLVFKPRDHSYEANRCSSIHFRSLGVACRTEKEGREREWNWSFAASSTSFPAFINAFTTFSICLVQFACFGWEGEEAFVKRREGDRNKQTQHETENSGHKNTYNTTRMKHLIVPLGSDHLDGAFPALFGTKHVVTEPTI